MIDYSEIQPWFFPVEPYEGESISHFLGRFRWENQLTPSGLAREAGLGGVIARWEKFRFIPYPSEEQVQKLAREVGLSVDQLWLMFPPQTHPMQLEAIRMCAMCYGEVPCHRMEWQLKRTQWCESHQVYLLSECPHCGARFKSPALWQGGQCHRCFLPFAEMGKFQKLRKV